MNEGYPLWVIITIAILGAFGTFFGKIKSSVELMIGGRQSIELHKLNTDKEEIGELKKRVIAVEKRNIRLIKSNTALTTAIMFMIDEYQKSNPDNKTVIESVRQLIKENLVNGFEYEATRPNDDPA